MSGRNNGRLAIPGQLALDVKYMQGHLSQPAAYLLPDPQGRGATALIVGGLGSYENLIFNVAAHLAAAMPTETPQVIGERSVAVADGVLKAIEKKQEELRNLEKMREAMAK